MFLPTNFDDGDVVIVASAVAVKEKLLWLPCENSVVALVPFDLVPFCVVPNNRTAILVCPSLKAVDVFAHKL